MSKLFVYGTLKKGYGNNSLLRTAEYIGEAELWGYDMYSLGGFPGIRPANGRNHAVVLGEVYEVEDFRRLDQLEGYDEDNYAHSMYLRRLVTIHYRHDDNRNEDNEVSVYVWNMDVIGRPIIKDGVWK